jgi:hypothetical protein
MALSAARDTQRKLSAYDMVHNKPVEDAKICYAGGLAAVKAGEYTPGAVATGMVGAGRFRTTVDNTDDGEVVDVEQGLFRWANSATVDAITAAHVGAICYIVDDQTVALTSAGATRSPAGVIYEVDSVGVWVLMTAEALPIDSGQPSIQVGAGTLSAGVLAISTGIALTSSSRIFLQRKTAAGTPGDELRVPTADRTTGIAGVAAINIRSYIDAVAATSDTSTIEWMIVG